MTPLVILLLLAGAAADPPAAPALPELGRETPLEVKTPDGMTLLGSVHRPLGLPEGDGLPVILALHPVGKSREYSENLISALLKRGFAVVSMDLRGHGRSRTSEDVKVISFPNLTPGDYRAMVGDQRLLVRKISGLPGLDLERAGIVGVGFSALIAGEAAGLDEHFHAVALVAPSSPFPGVTGTEGLARLGDRPAWIAAAASDARGLERARELAGQGTGERLLKPYDASVAQSYELLDLPGLADDLAGWLAGHLAAGNR